MIREQLEELAYDAIGYRPTTDKAVINDRWNAIAKLSNEELIKLINK